MFSKTMTGHSLLNQFWGGHTLVQLSSRCWTSPPYPSVLIPPWTLAVCLLVHTVCPQDPLMKHMVLVAPFHLKSSPGLSNTKQPAIWICSLIQPRQPRCLSLTALSAVQSSAPSLFSTCFLSPFHCALQTHKLAACTTRTVGFLQTPSVFLVSPLFQCPYCMRATIIY